MKKLLFFIAIFSCLTANAQCKCCGVSMAPGYGGIAVYPEGYALVKGKIWFTHGAHHLKISNTLGIEIGYSDDMANNVTSKEPRESYIEPCFEVPIRARVGTMTVTSIDFITLDKDADTTIYDCIGRGLILEINSKKFDSDREYYYWRKKA